MRPFLLTLLALFVLVALSGAVSAASPAAPLPPSPTPEPGGNTEEKAQVEQAVLEAVEGQGERILAFLVNNVEVEQAQLSEDRTWAIAWVALRDPESGALLPTEPGLALLRRAEDTWQVALPADPAWLEWLQAAPVELLDEETRQAWLEMSEQQVTVSAAIDHYLLPWAAGERAYLSRSVGHDSDIPSGSAHFSFDFYIPQTMFRIYAARAGTVWRAKWDVPNNDHSGTGNYIVLKDETTNPVTYQLYLHLAHESIPPALRQIGATVVQGQFVGLADNTGASTGHHLHFQVHANPDSYWGTALDITFDDVSINGGRPRRSDSIYNDRPYCRSGDVCEQFQSSYVSGNTVRGDVFPPIGGLLAPSNGVTAAARQLRVEAWASDRGSGLDRAQLIANYSGAWHEIGAPFAANRFALDWDLCAAEVPDGPLSLALQAWDREGNPSFGLQGLTRVLKDYDCTPPPPACSPSADQAALFAEPDYGGDCAVLGIGEYPTSASFGALGDDNVASLQVGANVLATLYSDASFAGRGETLATGDANLADNLAGSDRLTSLWVLPRSNPPPAPAQLVAPENGAAFPAGSSLTLSWRDAGGATEFQVELSRDASMLAFSPWLPDPLWSLQGIPLTAGTYTWRVSARNCPESGCASAWSPPSSFTIGAAPATPSTRMVPYTDDMEAGANGWSNSGLWNWASSPLRSHSGSHSWYYGRPAERDYRDGNPNSGDLTSPPVAIPAGSHLLSFWYYYQTEGPGSYWDRRRVQVSVDGGPFQDLLQLRDDVENEWLKAEVDLSPYAGKIIRLRFHFETLDGAFNGYEGWYVDDVAISAGSLPACGDGDDQPAAATPIAYGESRTGAICPSGDVDYYRFTGQAGDRVVVDLDSAAGNPPQDLDLIVFLLDGDGASVIASHDDEVPGKRLDPHLGYTLRRSGEYYIKVRLWSHPSAGGEAYGYSLHLSRDSAKPAVAFTSPQDGAYLAAQSALAVSAGDGESGVSRVEFWGHTGDWYNGRWELLGTDADGADGWSLTYDTTDLDDQAGLAFYARAYDWAGNWSAAGAWSLGVDRTPPISSLQPMAGSAHSTAFQVRWTGSDNLSGVARYDLQVQAGGGSWSAHSPAPDGQTTGAWFVGEAGKSYGFRLRAVDRAGNAEGYPTSAETSLSLPSAASLCAAPDQWEAGGSDNAPSGAVLMAVNAPPTLHNFCNPLEASRANDQDWARFSAVQGRLYRALAIPLVESAAVTLELYASDGTTLLAQAAADDFGEAAALEWRADRSEVVYLRARHTDGRVAGDGVTYLLGLKDTFAFFLPMAGGR